ncbi:MAG: hypothetical protein K6T31_05180, partial [Alicyclobacillus sp.]|nr:hypothetical protein [Alicyclobacillus sp.]
MPRRIGSYAHEIQTWYQNATIGSYFLGGGTLIIGYKLLVSAKYGRKVGHNPWHARTLEWTVSSPPPEHNFDEIPVVTDSPYRPYQPSELESA